MIFIKKSLEMESFGKIKEFYLSRKLNPITIKMLHLMGRQEIIRNYIEKVQHNKPFFFNLSYDTSNLTKAQKKKLLKFTKAEEKSGARMLENPSNKIPSTVDKTSFIPKADGKQKETVKRFLENEVTDWEHDATPSHDQGIA